MSPPARWTPWRWPRAQADRPTVVRQRVGRVPHLRPPPHRTAGRRGEGADRSEGSIVMNEHVRSTSRLSSGVASDVVPDQDITLETTRPAAAAPSGGFAAPVAPVAPTMVADPQLQVPAQMPVQVPVQVPVEVPVERVRGAEVTATRWRVSPAAVMAGATSVVLLLWGAVTLARAGTDAPWREPVVEVAGATGTAILGMIVLGAGGALLLAAFTRSRGAIGFVAVVLGVAAATVAIEPTVGADALGADRNGAIGALILLVVTLLVALLGMAAIAVIHRRGNQPLVEVLQHLKTPMLVSLVSSSTTASIPHTIEAMSARMGFSRGIVELVVPTASVFLRAGSALYYVLLALFVANLYDRTLSAADIGMIGTGATVAAFASAGNN
eukprot:gene42113-55910_t